mmetsp:Transcript_28958/g.53219  ORF Transcript_28958/g.53219 Transcript_28958/m.53219 type:complete len:177 (-) Transcript_28958:28-558(-)
MSELKGAVAPKKGRIVKEVPDEKEIKRKKLVYLKLLIEGLKSEASLCSHVVTAYDEIIEDILIDIAQKCHREHILSLNKLNSPNGVQPKLLSNEQTYVADMGVSGAAFSPTSTNTEYPKPEYKGRLDAFGQSHPAKATDKIVCNCCGRTVLSGSFAPHLEKCMGKGRSNTRLKRLL